MSILDEQKKLDEELNQPISFGKKPLDDATIVKEVLSMRKKVRKVLKPLFANAASSKEKPRKWFTKNV